MKSIYVYRNIFFLKPVSWSCTSLAAPKMFRRRDQGILSINFLKKNIWSQSLGSMMRNFYNSCSQIF